MKSTAVFLFILFLSSILFGQENLWTKETTDDEHYQVTYRLLEQNDNNGDEVQVLEYIVVTIASVDMQKCIAIMRDDANHTDFMVDAESSTRVKKISENEWITYYYFDATWPMPNSDCVTNFKIIEDPENRTVVITGKAVPEMYPDKGVKRLQYNNVKYIFKDLGNGKVKISMSVQVTPVISAPSWLIRTWFPEGAADTIKSLIELANKK